MAAGHVRVRLAAPLLATAAFLVLVCMWPGLVVGGLVIVSILWLTVAILLVDLREFRARRRKESGLCSNCGYDLRESKERCPECGTRRSSP